MTAKAIGACMGAMIVLGGGAQAADTKPAYPAMAPLAQYMIANPADEIAMARSAAPPSISDAADVMVLGPHGYEIAVKGTNGFVCLVERSWESAFDDAEFWNFHERGPICFNPAAARTVVPAHLERTDWVLAGVSHEDMLTRAKTSALANTTPAPGAMCFMLSKLGYLSDSGGHWHPHLMFYLPNAV